LAYEAENKPYIDSRRAFWPPGSDIELFMQNRQDLDDLSLSLEFQRVVNFCNGNTTRTTGPDEPSDGQDPLVAWLDERSYEDGVSRTRNSGAAFTSEGLAKELRKPVSICPESHMSKQERR
jgi:hypothetical protein